MLHVNHVKQIAGKFCLMCKCSRYYRAHYHCPQCRFVGNRVRTQRHFNFKHTSKEVRVKIYSDKRSPHLDKCLLVDGNLGVYMVQKNDYGINYPIHVQKMVTDTEIFVSCGLKTCKVPDGHECKHVKKVENRVFHDDNWRQSITGEEFSEEENSIVTAYINKIYEVSSNIVVLWKVSESLIYFSVVAFRSGPFTSFGRLFVRFNKARDRYSCKCGVYKKNRHCIHLLLAKLYNLYNGSNSEILDVKPTQDELIFAATDYESVSVDDSKRRKVEVEISEKIVVDNTVEFFGTMDEYALEEEGKYDI